MAFTPEQLKEYRSKLRAKGICTTCHKRNVNEKGKICDECQKERSDRQKRYIADPERCKCGRYLGEFDKMVGKRKCVVCMRGHIMERHQKSMEVDV